MTRQPDDEALLRTRANQVLQVFFLRMLVQLQRGFQAGVLGLEVLLVVEVLLLLVCQQVAVQQAATVLDEGAIQHLLLSGTELAQATAGSIRLKLLKIGAVITVSVRRVKVAMSSAFPQQEVFDHAFDVLSAAAR